MQQSASLLESAQLARRGWEAGQRANIDALTMQANYVLVRAWRAPRAHPSDSVSGGSEGGVMVVVATVVVDREMVVMLTMVMPLYGSIHRGDDAPK